jgi:2-polyprenyl-3-methyl-5-hydroxy-6-metoxy-1,4-benzoquinol methylase
MPQLIHYNECPVCGSNKIKNVLTVKDHTVSGEEFTVMECEGCTLRFTQDVPDAESIGPYYKAEAYISHTNTSQGLVNSLYQKVRRRTLQQKRKLIEKVTGLKTGAMLDVGAGTGAFVHTMKEAGWQVTGLEPDTDARTVSQKDFGVALQPMDNFYVLPETSFDAITMWHVLEHVHDLNGYIAKLKSLLKENGRLVIAVPNYISKDAVLYNQHWAAYDVPRHLYHFSPKAMQKLIQKYGLKIHQHKPMWFDSFYVSMLSSKYKTGKTKLFSSFFNGLCSNIKAMGDVKQCSSVIYIIGK